MRLRIHRGAQEIGGNCVELQSQGRSILLDLGLPLDAAKPDVSLLPQLSGLVDGSNSALLAVVLSHIHGDHHGLTGLLHANISVFMGERAKILLRASESFLRNTPRPVNIQTYANKGPFDLGPFRITPYLTDHSGFDAYSLLIEAENKRVFYSGDVRMHGRKSGLVKALIQQPPLPMDVLLLEGTTLSRLPQKGEPETEQQLEGRVLQLIKRSKGLVLVAFSPQNVDRFVTIFRATRRAGRTFIADGYLAHVLDQLAMPSLPSAGRNRLRVYLPKAQKRRIVADHAFGLVNKFRAARIFREEINADPARWVMLFRESMIPDVEGLRPGLVSTVIYSLWPGYLDWAQSKLAAWCRERHLPIDIAHTSGHADPETLVRIAKALRANVVIPVHTSAPGMMQSLIPNVRILKDNDWLDV